MAPVLLFDLEVYLDLEMSHATYVYVMVIKNKRQNIYFFNVMGTNCVELITT